MRRILIALAVAAVQIVLQVAVTVWAVKKAYALGHMDGIRRRGLRVRCAGWCIRSFVKEKRMSGWISVKEKLPTSDERVLVVCRTKKGVQTVNLAYCDGNGHWHGQGSMAGVTHWMPLPELPRSEMQ